MATKFSGVVQSKPTKREDVPGAEEDLRKILVIGETGAGKTSFIKFLLNYAQNHYGKSFELSEISQMLKVQRFSQTQCAKKWESDTIQCTKYIANFQDFRLGVIDTPGFGDTRPEYKETNTARIIAAIKGERYVNCVCLIVNGTQSRLTSVAEEVIREVTSILPRSIMNQVIVVCTKTRDKSSLDFSSDMLKEFGMIVPKKSLFYLDNPYAMWERAQETTSYSENESSEEDDSDEDEKDSELAKRFQKCHKKLDKIITNMHTFPPILTFTFGQLHDTVSEIEHVIAEIETEYHNKRGVEGKIRELQLYLKANEPIEKTKVHYYSRIVVKTSKKENLICHENGCYSNCHSNCDCWFVFLTPRACRMIEKGVCQSCSHSVKCHKITKYYFYREEAELPIKEIPDFKSIQESVKSKKGLLDVQETYRINSEKIIDNLTDKLKIQLDIFQGIGTNCHFLKAAEKIISEIRERINNITDYKHKAGITKILDNTLAVIRDPLTVTDSDTKYRWACGYLEINPENPDPSLISRQFRQHARACHPDSGHQDEESGKMFAFLNHAKELLIKRGINIRVPNFFSKAK